MKRALRKNWRWMLASAIMPLWLASFVSGQTNEEVVEAAKPVRDKPRIGNGAPALSIEETSLDLDKLNRAQVALADTDLFSAKSVYSPPPQLSVPMTPPESSVPPLPFTFIGRLVDGEVTTVFLLKQNQNYNLKVNDVVENTYRVEQIAEDHVVLTYLPLDAQQTLYTGRDN